MIQFSAAFGQSPKAIVLDDDLPGADRAVAKLDAEAVRIGGFEVSAVTVDQLDERRLAGVKLLVLPAARVAPVSTIRVITKFLEGGGDVIACGVPVWDSLVTHVNGKWMTRADFDAAIARVRADRLLAVDEAGWERASDNLKSPTNWKLRGGELHVAIDSLTNWDTLSRKFDRPFADGRTLTCFRAHGTAKTSQLSIEWQEAGDGSRWIATVNLSPAWQTYALGPEAFRPWMPPAGRREVGDRLNVNDASRLSVGLAFSHTDVARGAHEYWIADFGTAKQPFESAAASAGEIPALETLSPGYKMFPIAGPVTIQPAEDQVIVSATSSIDPPADLSGLHPRPGGGGFDKGRGWRWQPLLEARGTKGEYRGAIASLLVHAAHGPYHGGVWAAFTPTDSAFYRRSEMQKVLTQVATAMRRGTFLMDGGANVYTAFEGQAVKLGVNANRTDAALTGRVTLLSRGKASVAPIVHNFVLQKSNSESYTPDKSRQPGYRVVAELLDNGKVVDRVAHDLGIFHPADRQEFIESRDGGFFLEGKPWKAHGVNYMPSSGIGLDDAELFEHWIGAKSYDPVIIQRDLDRIRGMGLNAISIFIYRQVMEDQNLLDLLDRCRRMGIHVNLSLRPGTPLDFPWKDVREMIEFYKLAGNDTVFAYDLAWEACHWNHAFQQKNYAAAWKAWVEKKYGSIESAEKKWEVGVPRENGEFAVPPAGELTKDGEWRKLIADYRKFLDEFLAEKYGEAQRLIHSIDPHHAVSFRMNIAGDPTALDENLLGYDMWGLRDAVGLWGPEAYGRIGDWEQVKGGRFTRAYATLCDPAKPLMWAEMGVSVWDMVSMSPRPQRMDVQAQYFKDFYRMMNESGSDGIFYWWYPGGLRVNENSDFGIINPDGTDRPATKVIRDEGRQFLTAKKPKPADVWIEIERDGDARGLFGIYEKVKDAYWRAIDAGHRVGLKWATEPAGAK